MSYSAAVVSGCATGAAIRKLSAPLLATAVGARLVAFNALTSVTACGAGGWFNNYMIRAPETVRGIAVLDPATD